MEKSVNYFFVSTTHKICKNLLLLFDLAEVMVNLCITTNFPIGFCYNKVPLRCVIEQYNNSLCLNQSTHITICKQSIEYILNLFIANVAFSVRR